MSLDAGERRTSLVMGGFTCRCLPEARAPLAATYRQGRWAYDALRDSPDATTMRGRHPVVAADLTGVGRVAVKRLYHGGLLRWLTGDRFLSPMRGLSTVETADFLASKGVPTPEVVFVTWRRLRGLVRAEVGTRLIAKGVDASDYLFAAGGRLPAGWREQVAAIARLVARLHALGVVHGDLNLMNFHLGDDGVVQILDLDKVRLRTRPLAEGERTRNLARLERSIRKQGRDARPEDVDAVIDALRSGYGGRRAEA